MRGPVAMRPCSFSFPQKALTSCGFQKGRCTGGTRSWTCFWKSPPVHSVVSSEGPQGGRAGKVPGQETWGPGIGPPGRGLGLCSPTNGDFCPVKVGHGGRERPKVRDPLHSRWFITLLSHNQGLKISQGLFITESCFSGPKLLQVTGQGVGVGRG